MSIQPDLTPRQQQKILCELGLTAGEAKLYNYMMHNPKCHLARELVNVSGLSKSMVYKALSGLKQKGFVHGIRAYAAEHYQRIALTHALDNFSSYQRKLSHPLIKWDRNKGYHESASASLSRHVWNA